MNLYLTFKAIHIIAVISWMVGLFYLPRLFVYHVENNNTEISKVFKVMEKRLMKIIMNPAMIVTWLSGLYILWVEGFSNIFSLWLSIKLLFVIILSGYHGFLSKCLKDFELDRNKRTSKFFRVINEIPTIILIIIVFLVVFKPA
ncbi:MAG: protoporphyrinogen oxidase HemJ [Candidatus Fonsibacter sp.]|nr:protoporphyrinogen oxidase HemJ [Candidatus Fonsibacter sp.]